MTDSLLGDLAKVVALMNDREKPYSSLFSQENFIRTHHAEIARDHDDAERYRRIRENWIDCGELGLHGRLAVVDATVDAAMRANGGE